MGPSEVPHRVALGSADFGDLGGWSTQAHACGSELVWWGLPEKWDARAAAICLQA